MHGRAWMCTREEAMRAPNKAMLSCGLRALVANEEGAQCDFPT